MDAAVALRGEACRANERRLLVLAGSPADTRRAAADALDAAAIDEDATAAIGTASSLPGSRIDPERSGTLLGTTHDAVVVDCHPACQPNALGRAAGAVDGGGLLILLVPPLDAWPDRRDGFDKSLAVPPFGIDDVAGHFRRRLVRTLRQHPGVAVVDVVGTEFRVERDGLTDPPPRSDCPPPSIPQERAFPRSVYRACVTDDQVRAVNAIEGLPNSDGVAVLESDRGRGKSSAAGLAAAGHALHGLDVLVTAPTQTNAGECFDRARELLAKRGALAAVDEQAAPGRLETVDGCIRFEPPSAAVDLPGAPDVAIVDEAAGLPVRVLEAMLDAPAVAYATTIHGYEGAGRSFSVRFRERLATTDRSVTSVRLNDPIRYARGDPVEIWSFRALALNAEPAPDGAVSGLGPAEASYIALTPTQLRDDDTLLREAFGLLVLAHYRTEPDDLARLLDAPNVSVRALCAGDRVLGVALLAREGGLDAELRASMYEGERVRGNMLPDILTSQLRDETAGESTGLRVMRIVTHPALRSQGHGSRLLAGVRNEVGPDVDWLGVGYGATPELVSFWRTNGFRSVHLSTTRNDRSGEHSAIMLSPTSPTGERLLERHTDWFLQRLPAMLSDALTAVEPDVVRAVLRSIDRPPAVDLSTMEWRVAAGLPHGAAIFDTAPRAVRRLALRHLVDPNPGILSARAERLLVIRALQARPWSAAAEALGYDSHARCMRALGTAAGALVAEYGDATGLDELARFE